jgi:hypothetical protein
MPGCWRSRKMRPAVASAVIGFATFISAISLFISIVPSNAQALIPWSYVSTTTPDYIEGDIKSKFY